MSALVPDRDTPKVPGAGEGGHRECSLDVDGFLTTATRSSAVSLLLSDIEAGRSARGNAQAVTLLPASFSTSSSGAAASNEQPRGQQSLPLIMMENETKRSWQPSPPESAYTSSSRYVAVVPGDVVDTGKVDGDARKTSTDALRPSAPVRVPFSSNNAEDDLEAAMGRVAAVQARKAKLNQKFKLSGHHQQSASSSASGATNSLGETKYYYS